MGLILSYLFVYYSGALAGIPFAIDREALASDLGFHGVTNNSLDAVSDRDFVCKLQFSVYLQRQRGSFHIS